MSGFVMRKEKKGKSAAGRSKVHSVRKKDHAGIPVQLRARWDALAYTHEIHPGGEARSTGVGRDHNTSESGTGKRVAIIQRMRNNVVQKCAENENNSSVYRNWKGEVVKVPVGFVLSERDPDFSAKPIISEGPFTTEQREQFLQGNSAGTKLSPHHRHQIPVRDGGVIDEIPGPHHPSGNQHTAGTPNRHPNKSIFKSEVGGEALRQAEIKQHWIDKGNRLIQIEENRCIDPGY